MTSRASCRRSGLRLRVQARHACTGSVAATCGRAEISPIGAAGEFYPKRPLAMQSDTQRYALYFAVLPIHRRCGLVGLGPVLCARFVGAGDLRLHVRTAGGPARAPRNVPRYVGSRPCDASGRAGADCARVDASCQAAGTRKAVCTRDSRSMEQLVLDLSRPPAPTLENFAPGSNSEAVAVLRDWLAGTLQERCVYLCGPRAAAKAICCVPRRDGG